MQTYNKIQRMYIFLFLLLFQKINIKEQNPDINRPLLLVKDQIELQGKHSFIGQAQKKQTKQ